MIDQSHFIFKMPCEECGVIIAILKINKFNYANIQINQNKLMCHVIAMKVSEKGEKSLEDSHSFPQYSSGLSLPKTVGEGYLINKSISSKILLHHHLFKKYSFQ